MSKPEQLWLRHALPLFVLILSTPHAQDWRMFYL